MAKQNVGFGERHVEKFVAGAIGAIFLGVVFLYGIQDPYTVTAGSEEVGPGEFYRLIQEESERVARAMRDASPPAVQPWKPPAGAAPGKTAVVTEMTAVPVAINPTVPRIEADIQVGNLKLVEILPPSQPITTTGRGYAAVPPPEVRTVSEAAVPAAQPVTPLPQDLQWVALFAVVDRKAQQEAFIKAKYAVSRQQLAVMGVELERQRLMPDGEWASQTEILRPYSPWTIEAREKLNLVQDNTGEQVLTQADYDYRDDLMRLVATRDAQDKILRPSFQSLLPQEAQTDWKVPEAGKLPGVEIDWGQDFQVAVEEKKEETGRAGAGAAPLSGRQQVKKLHDDLDAATKKEDWLEADRLLKEIEGHPEATPDEKRNAVQLQRNIRGRVLAAELQEQTRQSPADSGILGPDKDVMWATDTTAEPGQTYRYRIRLLAVNQHAGFTRLMANPEDAAKLVLTGQWSQWSEPVTVPQNNYFFFTSVNEQNKTARVEINRWTRGGWVRPGRQDVTVGQPISWTDQFVDYTYDGVVAALDFNEPYLVRNVSPRDGTIDYGSPKTSAVLTLITSDGDVEERIADVDVRERRGVTQMIKEEDKKQKEREGTLPEIRPPTRDRNLDTPRGPDRYELDRGRGRSRGRGIEDW